MEQTCNNSPREDRRHINEFDLKQIKKLKIPLNLEIAATNEMLKIALKVDLLLFV